MPVWAAAAAARSHARVAATASAAHVRTAVVVERQHTHVPARQQGLACAR